MLRPDLKTIAHLIPARATVLDLGCGDGALLEYLVQQKLVRGRGIEISEAGVLACVRRGLSVRQGNIEEGLADYPPDSVDFVVLSQTLPYLNNPAAILGEMLRVGRRAIVSFPNWGYWRCRLDFLLRGKLPQSPDSAQTWRDERRWQFFTAADFDTLCSVAGFCVGERVFLGGGEPIKGTGVNWRARTAVYLLEAGGRPQP